MPTISATVKFKTYVSENDAKGLNPYAVIKSRINNARDIWVVDFEVENEQSK